MPSRSIKRCSKSLVLKELQLRTTVRYQHTTIIMNDIKKPDEDAGKNMGQLELSRTTGGNVRWYDRFGKRFDSLSGS